MFLHKQNSLQKHAYGIDYSKMNDEEKIASFKDMVLALTDELHEALNEMGWKPWATSKHFNTEAVKGELIDALHFLMNLMLIAGMDDGEVARRYIEKRNKNIARQEAGYDGVSTKCPGCKRALDDDAVKCRPWKLDSQVVICEITGEFISRGDNE